MIMSKQRIIMTNEEKMAHDIIGQNAINFNMAEGKIEDIFKREKSKKFNEEVDKYAEKLSKHVENLQDVAEQLSTNAELIEIKPMFNRILIKPFQQNPFQRIVIDKTSNIVTDTGGLAPEYFNQDSGKQESSEQMIITGAIQEVGPEVKYVVPGDVVMYRKETAMPVPFYKQGLMCIAENQIIAVINEGLEQRFKDIKDGRN